MDLKAVIESLIISARKPLSLEQLNLLTGRPTRELARTIAELEARYETFGIRLLKVGDGYKFGPHPQSAEWIAAILDESVPLRALDSSHSGTVPLEEVSAEPASLTERRTSEVLSEPQEGLRPSFTGPLVRTLTPETAVRGLVRQEGGLRPQYTGPTQRPNELRLPNEPPFPREPLPSGVPTSALRDAKTVEVPSGEHELPDPSLTDPLDESRTEETASREVTLPPLPPDDGETKEVPLREVETLAAEERVTARKEKGESGADGDLHVAVDRAIARAEALLRDQGSAKKKGKK